MKKESQQQLQRKRKRGATSQTAMDGLFILAALKIRQSTASLGSIASYSTNNVTFFHDISVNRSQQCP
jgi:hypothetical protein